MFLWGNSLFERGLENVHRMRFHRSRSPVAPAPPWPPQKSLTSDCASSSCTCATWAPSLHSDFSWNLMGANGGRIGVFIGFNFDVIYCRYIEMCVCVMATPRQFTGSLWEMAYLVRWFIKDGDFPVRTPLRWPEVLTTEIRLGWAGQNCVRLDCRWPHVSNMWCLKHLPKWREACSIQPRALFFHGFFYLLTVKWYWQLLIHQPISCQGLSKHLGSLGVPCHGTAQPQSSLSWEAFVAGAHQISPDCQIDFKYP
jgi:hypothetical protein